MTMVNPPTDVVPNPPFLGLYTEEDMGLKTLLQGVTVTDLNAKDPDAPRPVPVWFHNPEREERRITYPNIVINFTGERVAHEREHRGYVPIGYRYLQNIPLPEPNPSIWWPTPLDFDYTVTASARINQHISQISGTLAMGRLHPRFAQMDCPGGTVRRITIMGVSRTNSMEADKRLFRQIYQVRISTEVEDPVTLLTTRVRRLALTITDMQGNTLRSPRYTSTINPGGEPAPETPGQYQSVEE
jgi:hypothetical protein